ncbi:helix-turn-helix transcriptional regulator [Streptomyces bobili]|uniref:helix-turn-helix domain-containing protein n=1 Tax=Streptomyces bobili TaxID=67280 RepID=UPI003434A359
MNDEVSAQDSDNPPSVLSRQLKARLSERAEREGVKKISTYALAAALNDQARRAGRRLPKGKKEFVTPQYLGMLIRGEQDDPRLSVVEELADYLGCTLDELAGRVLDQADVLERLRRAGLEDIGMRAASLEPDRLNTLRGMLDVLENQREP